MSTSPHPEDRVAVIVGSTRPSRICPGIAAWTRRELAGDEHGDVTYELVDLRDVDLPMLDEPRMAALGDYEHEHTRRWSARIGGFAGFVIVAPQYNWGYPAVVKNALDYLYDEWRAKPVTTVTYGTRGGAKAADQLMGVFGGLHMHPLEERVELVITKDDLDDDWQLLDLEAVMRPYRDRLRRIDAQMRHAFAQNRERDTLPAGR